MGLSSLCPHSTLLHRCSHPEAIQGKSRAVLTHLDLLGSHRNTMTKEGFAAASHPISSPPWPLPHHLHAPRSLPFGWPPSCSAAQAWHMLRPWLLTAPALGWYSSAGLAAWLLPSPLQAPTRGHGFVSPAPASDSLTQSQTKASHILIPLVFCSLYTRSPIASVPTGAGSSALLGLFGRKTWPEDSVH